MRDRLETRTESMMLLTKEMLEFEIWPCVLRGLYTCMCMYTWAYVHSLQWGYVKLKPLSQKIVSQTII
jgi:hypothetical protein